MTRIFIAWKEHVIRTKLAKLFLQKRYIRGLYRYVKMRNYVLPRRYRVNRVKSILFNTLADETRSKWNDRRSDIIVR